MSPSVKNLLRLVSLCLILLCGAACIILIVRLARIIGNICIIVLLILLAFLSLSLSLVVRLSLIFSLSGIGLLS